jgi:hypothetical protein
LGSEVGRTMTARADAVEEVEVVEEAIEEGDN